MAEIKINEKELQEQIEKGIILGLHRLKAIAQAEGKTVLEVLKEMLENE